jgi:integrase
MSPGRPRASFPSLAQRMPIEEWPATDRLAWEQACRPAPLLTMAGLATGLAHITREKRAGEWGRYLSYLRDVGELDADEPTAQRLNPTRLAGYIGSLRSRMRDISAWYNVNDLSYFVPLIAPGHDWSWVRRHPAMPTLREVRASRKPISPPDPTLLFARALQFCRSLAASPLSETTAVRFRDGLIVAFATWSVLRRKNLAEMEIGRHLMIYDNFMRVVFDTSVKNDAVIDSPVPELLRPNIVNYLCRYRPRLLKMNVDFRSLWITSQGAPLAYGAFADLFKRMGIRLIGRPISVHSARHAYASMTLSLDARDIEMASAGLAHAGTSSVNRYYDRSSGDGVSKAWLRVLGKRRRSG